MKVHYRSMHWTYTSNNGQRKAKAGYATLEEALLAKSRTNIGKELVPYVCDVCGMWHLGHSKLK